MAKKFLHDADFDGNNAQNIKDATITGDLHLTKGAGDKKVLTSDATGKASWAAAATGGGIKTYDWDTETRKTANLPGAGGDDSATPSDTFLPVTTADLGKDGITDGTIATVLDCGADNGSSLWVFTELNSSPRSGEWGRIEPLPTSHHVVTPGNAGSSKLGEDPTDNAIPRWNGQAWKPIQVDASVTAAKAIADAKANGRFVQLAGRELPPTDPTTHTEFSGGFQDGDVVRGASRQGVPNDSYSILTTDPTKVASLLASGNQAVTGGGVWESVSPPKASDNRMLLAFDGSGIKWEPDASGGGGAAAASEIGVDISTWADAGGATKYGAQSLKLGASTQFRLLPPLDIDAKRGAVEGAKPRVGHRPLFLRGGYGAVGAASVPMPDGSASVSQPILPTWTIYPPHANIKQITVKRGVVEELRAHWAQHVANQGQLLGTAKADTFDQFLWTKGDVFLYQGELWQILVNPPEQWASGMWFDVGDTAVAPGGGAVYICIKENGGSNSDPSVDPAVDAPAQGSAGTYWVHPYGSPFDGYTDWHPTAPALPPSNPAMNTKRVDLIWRKLSTGGGGTSSGGKNFKGTATLVAGTPKDVAHSLGTEDVITQVFDSTKKVVDMEIQVKDANTVTLTSTKAGTYTVRVMGF